VVLMPGETQADGASNLRVYRIADELKRLGWNAYVCPRHLRLRQRLRVIGVVRPNVILMQMARHPLNRPRFYSDIPVVFDIDDADYLEDRHRANIVEAVERSAAIIAGSRAIAGFCRKYNDDVEVVWTGTPVFPSPSRPQSRRKHIISWAALLPSHCAKEAEFLLRVLELLLERTAEFQFLLYCDDGTGAYRAFADRFRAIGVDVMTRPRLEYAEFVRSLEDVAVGLAPLVDLEGFSGGKSFGKVLAYMAAGVPIVTHPVVDHPLFFRSGENGYMATTPKEWAAVIAQLLDSPEERQRLAERARAELEDRLSTAEAARRVDKILRRALAKAHESPRARIAA